MKVTEFTKDVLSYRKHARDMRNSGYEFVGRGEGNHALLELHNGSRMDHRIVDAVIAQGGKGIWVKIEKKGE